MGLVRNRAKRDCWRRMEYFNDEHGNWGGGLYKKCWLCGEEVQFLNGTFTFTVQQFRSISDLY